jgi:hypothetical protein
MKYALYGTMKLGEINPALAASATNYVSQVTKFFDPGCHTDFELGIDNSFFESKNYCSGVGVIDFIRPTDTTFSASAVFDSASREALRAFMRSTDIAADSAPVAVVGQSLNPATGAAVYKAGDVTYLGRMNITSLSITGNAVALASGTDYDLDPVFGKITWKQNITGAVVAGYSYQNPASSSIANAPQKDYVVLLDGYNYDGGAPGQLVLYKVKPALDGNFPFTTTEKSTMSVKLGMQADTSKAYGGLLGQIGQIRGFGIPERAT